MKTTLNKTLSKHASGQNVIVQVSLFFINEEGGYVSAYCPVMDLAGQGTDERTAMESFHIVLQLFLEETTRKGTLESILKKLGWKYRSDQNAPSPPKFKAPKFAFDQKIVDVALPL